ncbi:DUF2971 domain-containing protein [Pseudoalteromonas rubra]|uniref:DUF2971 domain-containing protein n=1 Tax=Pseudoalteromonas rubra TaxID=43658 RepID=A0A0U3I4H5_9GAMM|nr:DUF2971 domain-containing protein [Pseudoalteromonas rubra]ALU41943.1 hypothetical protein AT705_02755 [Pseudoalteromonas rubra]
MTSVFKFRAATEDHDIDALVQGYLWFSKLKDLNDPFEGGYYLDDQASKELLFKYHANVLAKKPLRSMSPDEEVVDMYIDKEMVSPGGYEQWLKQLTMEEIDEELSKLRDVYSIFSCSLSKEDHPTLPAPLNSMSMWGYYANGLKGFCIEYDLEVLMQSLNETNDYFESARVAYTKQDTAPTIVLEDVLNDAINGTVDTHKNYLRAIMTKCDNPWHHENEMRIIGECRDGEFKHSLNAIKAIYIGGKMENHKQEQIKGFALKNSIPTFRVFHSIRDKAYGFKFELLKPKSKLV